MGGMTAEDVNAAFQKACDGPMNGVLEISNEPLVSVYFRKSDYSSSVDGSPTMVMGDDMVKVVAWYDNEWGYSQRVVDLAELVADKAGTPKSSGDPLEDYCEGNPGAEECIVFTAKRALAPPHPLPHALPYTPPPPNVATAAPAAVIDYFVKREEGREFLL